MSKEKKKKLYAVANAHLDTQWNWTIQDVIRDSVKDTLVKNFELLDKYPNYHMNFEGAFRYKLAKEYYPDLYEKLKEYIAEGRWSVAGSTWDAMDANVPSSEALMRQILYGNGYFEKEFGKKSTDIFLTDCFGFSYALPSIAAHMGLNGFSTQKLVWGVGSPIYEEDGTVSKPMPEEKDPFADPDKWFPEKDKKPRMDLGKWVGPDGKFVAASFLEGDYTYNFDKKGDTRPVNQREEYLKQIEHNEKYTGHSVRSMYYGTGDYGGSCKEISAQMVNDAVNDKENGLYEVIAASTDQLFNDLTPEEREALPAYDGELLIPHGSGAVTSHTISKRWNRKNELLADSAEKASVMAAWLGASEYPSERLLTAWQTFLWHQFHDDLPGTSIASAYVFTYNDYVIALNLFAAELENAVGGIAGALDTNVQGTPVVVYNPVSCERNDVVAAEIPVSTPYVRVFDGMGREVPAQLSRVDGKTVVKFVAKTAPVSCTVYEVRESEIPCQLISAVSVSPAEAESSQAGAGIAEAESSQIGTGGFILQNQRYQVTIDQNGDIASILDKANENFELLESPIRLEIGPDSSCVWPSWELVWTDSLEEPAYVGGNPMFEIVDNGPAVVSVKVTRTYNNSTFEQTISLWNDGQRVDVANRIDWSERKANLRAAFPLSVSNPKATFDLGLGAIENGNTDNFPYYQHLVHQWADLTAEDGSYGVSILNDCKYGMDKPKDNVLRLTLIHTPAAPFSQASGQDWQDMGLNVFTYSITGHKGVRGGEAAALNQPLMPFTAPKHGGLGRSLSFVSVSDPNVIIRCIKKEEKGDRIVVRVQETSGRGAENCSLTFAADLVSAVETNGYEEEIGAAEFAGNQLTCTLTPYAVKTFAISLKGKMNAANGADSAGSETCSNSAANVQTLRRKQEPIALPYNKKVTSSNSDRTAGEFADGISIPSELYSEEIVSGGIRFTLAPAEEANAVEANGQVIELPAGYRTLYLLAASRGGDKTVTFLVDGNPVEVKVQDYKENVGSWTMMVNAAECVIKHDEIAAVYTHTHDADGDRLYLFAYLFKYALDITGAKTVTLPADSDLIIMAATASDDEPGAFAPLAPLYDEVEQKDVSLHKLTAVGAKGSGEYPAGKKFLIQAKRYEDRSVFDGWEGDCIQIEDEATAMISMPDHDAVVTARRKKLGEDVLCGKPCQVSSNFNPVEVGPNAVNGDEHSKWCTMSKDGTHWLEVDAQETVTVDKWFVMHAGVYEPPTYNTRKFRLEYKLNEGDEWKTADSVTDNEMAMTYRSFEPVEARYFRLWIDQATQNPKDSTTRIYMFEVHRA